MRALFIFTFIYCGSVFAQNSVVDKKINLDDVQIKGEAQGKGMSVLARTKNSLDGRVPIRTQFKNEIAQELPVRFSTGKKDKN